ncbi:MAG: nitroreductase family protein [Candidatus Zixiibacteriota bacterium]
MSGIVFFGTRMLAELEVFYTKEIGCAIWMKQAHCTILKLGNLLIGFCQGEPIDKEGLITFFYDTPDEVDEYYEKFKNIAIAPPKQTDEYNIYNFFARDPEGRKLEFQYFNDCVANFRTGDEILRSRRSIRKYKDTPIPDELLNHILDNCRFAPTARNTQGYYFKIIRDREIIEKLSEVHGSSTKPIANGPIAVAICADPSLTKRAVQDGCIAAYHFILASWEYGLGTCWIAAMDQDDVKKMLNIPAEHYVATVTPLGYPENFPVKIPERKGLDWFIKP